MSINENENENDDDDNDDDDGVAGPDVPCKDQLHQELYGSQSKSQITNIIFTVTVIIRTIMGHDHDNCNNCHHHHHRLHSMTMTTSGGSHWSIPCKLLR